MTFSKHLIRGIAVGALAVGLSSPMSAQNGTNFHVMSNSFEGIAGGVGSGMTGGGGVAAPLLDGLGTWLPGEDMQGNIFSALVGDYAYRQVGSFVSACALGFELHFPSVMFIEFDGRDGYRPEIFVEPACLVGGGLATSVLAYGTPPGASASFFLGVGLSSGLQAAVNPGSTAIMIPNNGIVPSSNGGTFGAIAATEFGPFALGSSGGCWILSYTWLPTALQSLDHIDGWWQWLSNAGNGSQYFGLSVDELNAYTSNSLVTLDSHTGAAAFLANVEYEWHNLVRDPTPHMALAPAGAAGPGPYYASPSYAGISVNGGVDIGRHPAYSSSGAGGSVSGLTSPLGTQDPAGATIPGLVPTLGFHTWDNEKFGATTGHATTIWWQTDFAAFLPTGAGGLTPDMVADVGVGPGVRMPITPFPFPGPFQSLSISFLGTWAHFPTTSVTAEPDPLGFGGGSFGAPAFWAATFQIPTGAIPVCSIGFPLPFDFGSTGFNVGKGLITDPTVGRVGISQNFNFID
jgi:hypothetical protein